MTQTGPSEKKPSSYKCEFIIVVLQSFGWSYFQGHAELNSKRWPWYWYTMSHYYSKGILFHASLNAIDHGGDKKKQKYRRPETKYKICKWSKYLKNCTLVAQLTYQEVTECHILNSQWQDWLSTGHYLVINGNKQMWKIQIAQQMALMFKSHKCQFKNNTAKQTRISNRHKLISKLTISPATWFYFEPERRGLHCIEIDQWTTAKHTDKILQ